MLLLHGLFGMGSNLRSLAHCLQDHFRVFSIDLPNHGRSDWSRGMGLVDTAAHLRQWVHRQGLGRIALVGHSLGGKVAMELALTLPEQVRSLVVADIAPVPYERSHDAVFDALEAVAAADCRSRADAQQILGRYLQEDAVIQFLLLSLARGDDGRYRWRFNVDGLQSNYPDLLAAPAGGRAYGGPVLFIKGGDSPYIRAEHRAASLALFPHSELRVIPGTGHWLHAEKPHLFNGIVRRFLLRE